MASRKIEVEILGDASSLQKAFNKGAGASTSFGSSLLKLGKIAAVGLAAVGAGAVVAGGKMLSLAGDAEEVNSKLNVVFGKALPELSKNLSAFSEATGASSFKLREQAADLGALLGPLVGTKKGAADMSTEFVKLATDLGSFNNVPVEEALLAIRSGLVGEAEPLRRFGVLLNDAAVKTQALEMGLVKGNKELTEQQKVMARAALIMKQTTQAQGDAIRTSGSYTNQIKRLKNNFTDLATTMGSALIPAATAAAGLLNKFIENMGNAEGASAKFQVALDTLKTIATTAAAGLVSVFTSIDWSAAWAGLLASATTVAEQLRAALDAQLGALDWGNVGQKISDGIVAAISGVGAVGKKIADTITASMAQVNWEALGKTVGPGLAAALVTAFATLLDPSFWIRNWELALAVGVVAFGGVVGKVAGKMLAPFAALGGSLVLAFAGVIEKTFGTKVASAVLAGFTRLPPLITAAITKLTGIVGSGFAKLGSLAVFTLKVLGVSAVINVLSGLVTSATAKLRQLHGAFVAQGQAWVAAASAAIGRAVKAVIEKLKDLPPKTLGELGRMVAAVMSIGPAMAAAGFSLAAQLISGILGGLGGLAGRVGGAVASGLRGAIGIAGGILHGSGPFQFTKQLVGEQMVKGAMDGWMLGMAGFGQKVGESLKTVIEARTAALGTAFQGLGSYIDRAFGAKTQAMVAALSGKFDEQINKVRTLASALTDAERAAQGLSPAETALADLDKSEGERGRAVALQQAEAALLKAQAVEDVVERAAAVAAAEEQMRSAKLAITRQALTEQAAVERAALNAQAAEARAIRDAAAAAEIAALEAQRAVQIQNLEETRRQEQEALTARLNQLIANLEKHPKEWGKTQKAIIAELAKYGIDYKNSGELLGEAFAAGLKKAEKAVIAAAKRLAKIPQDYLQLKSPAEKGPLSTIDKWWKPMGPMLARQMSLGAVAGGAARMAGAASMARPAMAGVSSGGGNGGGGWPERIVLQIDGRTVTEVVRRELQRQSKRNG